MGYSMKKFIYITTLFSIILCISGCYHGVWLTSKVTDVVMKKDPLQGIDENYIRANVKLGVTTEQQILSMFGTPAKRILNQNERGYSFGNAYVKYEFSKEYRYDHWLTVLFDDNNIVKYYHYEEQDDNINVNITMPDPQQEMKERRERFDDLQKKWKEENEEREKWNNKFLKALEEGKTKEFLREYNRETEKRRNK